MKIRVYILRDVLKSIYNDHRRTSEIIAHVV